MNYHLLTVQAIQSHSDEMVFVLPRVLLESLPHNMMIPMQNDPLELRLPDGRVLSAQIFSFGVGMWEKEDGHLYLESGSPGRYELNLTIAGVTPEDVPEGTEIWLSPAKFSERSW